MIMITLCLMLLTASEPAHAQALRLSDMLTTMRQKYAAAEVVGRFHDWRTVSIYRSHAGLHYGYDITMPRGASVPAAWDGVVVAIVPWTGPQYGITVQTATMRTTYGHLSPLVSVGQTIHAGQPVGVICIDHVDVKMRDGAGNFVDFGAGDGISAPSYAAPPQYAEFDPEEARELLRHDRQELRHVNALASSMVALQAEGIMSRREAAQTVERKHKLLAETQRLRTDLGRPLNPGRKPARRHRTNEKLLQLYRQGLISSRELEARR
jgi:hypothetical protein